ncbi:MAG: hypothetical protein QW683_08415 [Candidatus Caldarchaeum sp.]
MMRFVKRYIGSLALVTALFGGAKADEIHLDEGWSIGGQVLAQGERAEFTRRFQRDRVYFIRVSGTANAQDVDVQILDADGQLITQDIGSEKEAQLRFVPRKSGDYTIRVSLAKSTGRALCYFVVLRLDGGWSVPLQDIEAALGRLTALDRELTDYRLQRFYGFVMREAERQSIQIGGLETNRYVVVAVGDDLADDIDLAVFAKGRLLDSDELEDAVPITEFTASESVEVRVSYVSGSGPALVVMALYELAKPEAKYRH